MSKKIAIIFSLVLFSLSLSFSASATLETDVSNIRSDTYHIRQVQDNIYTRLGNIYNRLDTTNSSLSTINSNLGTISTKVGNIQTTQETLVSVVSTKLTSIINNMVDYSDSLDSIDGHLESLDNNLTSAMPSIVSDVSNILSRLTTHSTYLSGIQNNTGLMSVTLSDIYDYIEYTIEPDIADIKSDVNDLRDFFVNPQHKALEDAATSSVVNATSIYRQNTGGSSTSQKVSELGSFSTSISDNLSTGVSAGNVFSVLDSGNTGSSDDGGSIFGFFTQQSMNNMDSTVQTRNSSDPPIVTHYLSNNQSVFDSFLGGDSR